MPGALIRYIKRSLTPLLLLLCFSAAGQRYFQQVTDPTVQHNFSETKHVPTLDSGFAILSRGRDIANQSVSVLIKTDKTGKTEWQKKLELPAGYYISSLSATPDSGLLAIGVIPSTTAVPRDWLLVMKLNYQGNIIWSKVVHGGNFSWPVSYVANNRIYIAGIVVKEFTAEFSIFILQLDSTGNIAGFDTRRAQRDETITGIIVNQQAGYIYLCGSTKAGDPQGNPLLVVVSPTINIQWMFDINIPGAGGATGIGQYGNNFWLISPYNNGAINGSVVISATSAVASSSQLLPTAIISRPLPVSLQEIKGVSDGILLAGEKVRNSLGNTEGLLVKLRDNFGVEWARSYGDTNTRYKWFSSLQPGFDGDISLCGPAIKSHYYGSQFLNTDATGLSGCEENPENISVQTGTHPFTSYSPVNGSFNVQMLDGGVVPEDIPIFETKEVCKTDTCRAGFVLPFDTVCSNICLTITDTSKYARNWAWEFENGTPATHFGKNPPLVCFKTPGYHRIRLITSNSVNTDTSETYIRVWPLPVADAGLDTTICENDTIRLSGSGGVDYAWTPVNFKNSSDLPNPRVFPKNEIIYYLQVTDTNGCTSADSIKVSVIKKPELKNTDSVICMEGELLLDAGNPGFRHLWSTGATSRFITAPPGNYFAIVSNTCFTDTVKYTITGKDCKLDFYIPNAFSPNGDGLNDVFAITGENIGHINLLIFNRWGQCVFSGSGPSPAWNGMFGDMLCPDNIYIYSAEIAGVKNGKKTVRGVITLIR